MRHGYKTGLRPQGPGHECTSGRSGVHLSTHIPQAPFILAIGKANCSRLVVVEPTSLERPYQRSSLRCSEGRGGMFFFFFQNCFSSRSAQRYPQRSLQTTFTFPPKKCHTFFFQFFFSRPKVITNDYRYPFRPPFNFLPYYTCINTSHHIT